MKLRMIILLISISVILFACQTSRLSFSKIDLVSEEIEQVIQDDLTLQMIQEGEMGSYIIFHAAGDIEADLDIEDNVLTVVFNEVDSNATEQKRFVYYLTPDKNHDTIRVKVNGQERPFDDITLVDS